VAKPSTKVAVIFLLKTTRSLLPALNGWSEPYDEERVRVFKASDDAERFLATCPPEAKARIVRVV